MKHDDERRVRNNAPEVRGDLASQDAQRTTEDGLISDEEFSRLLNSEFDQTALPRPPEMPGWHLCWLTTTSSYDTLQKRQRLGYMPVRSAELPGFDPTNGKGLVGHDGFVTCNEMILCKIRKQLHEKIMDHFHHKVPMQEESSIFDRMKQAETQDSAGRQLVQTEGDGFNDLEESVKRAAKAAPTFSA